MSYELFHTELIQLVIAAGIVELPRLVGLQGVVETPCGEIADVTLEAVDMREVTYDLRRNSSGRIVTRKFGAKDGLAELVWDVPMELHADLKKLAKQRAVTTTARSLHDLVGSGSPSLEVADWEDVVSKLQRLQDYVGTESVRSRKFLNDLSRDLVKRPRTPLSYPQLAWLIDIAKRVSMSALNENA